MSIKNVAIVGASGNLGGPFLDTFTKNSPFNTTVISRQGSKATFPSGVKVIQVDYNSPSSLKDAFQGQDAIISLVGGAAIESQIKLIDAAIEAGVKHFIPSEFGSNTQDALTIQFVPAFASKVKVVDYLKSKESQISWTGIATGVFFDWGLKIGFLDFDFKTKTATLYDEGKATFSGTNLPEIALATIKVLENPDVTKNQYISIAGVTTTQKEVLAIAEKVTGEKWTVKTGNAKDLYALGQEKLQKGDFSGIGDLIHHAVFSAENNLLDLTKYGLWNEKLGLKSASIEDTIKSIL